MIRRKYFGTDGVRGEVGGPVINAEFALRLGYAAGRVLAREHAVRGGSRPQVVIGKDTRISGYMLNPPWKPGCRRRASTCCWPVPSRRRPSPT